MALTWRVLATVTVMAMAMVTVMVMGMNKIISVKRAVLKNKKLTGHARKSPRMSFC